ncbi:FAD-dependent oxidoreductase [Sphingobacteriales bacterium CHB3]|nr:FAD-dependent oxidoreductase [Sphingobacteriales bacterium CHB3]
MTPPKNMLYYRKNNLRNTVAYYATQIQWRSYPLSATKADILIIGGGLYGCATAYNLARLGAKNVVVLERKAVCSGGTAKSCAIVRTHYSIEANMVHAVESLKIFANFNQIIGGDCGWRRTGYLIVGPEEHRQPMQMVFRMQNKYGVDTQTLTPAEAHQIHPLLNFDDVGVIDWSDWRQVDPTAAIATPNDYYWIQVKTSAALTNASITYRETRYNQITTSVETALSWPNGGFRLHQNYPNPFNASTTIRYTLSAESKVSLKIYNILGQQVAQLVDASQPAGEYRVRWNAVNAATGVYFCRLQTEGGTTTKKLLLLR